MEAQIAKEKKRIAGEVSRLNKEIKQLESSLAKKEKQFDGKKSSIRNAVARLKSLYDVENTQVVIYNDDKEKYDRYVERLSSAARIFEVTSIISPVSIFDICSSYTGKDCVNNEDLSSLDKVFVGGALIPYGGKLFKAAKVMKNGKKVLEVVEATGRVFRGVNVGLKPVAENQSLSNVIEQLYRSGASIGSGSTADAIRYELKTGELVGGKSHIQKGEERIRNLENILKSEDLNRSDSKIAEAIIDDLKDALAGN